MRPSSACMRLAVDRCCCNMNILALLSFGTCHAGSISIVRILQLLMSGCRCGIRACICARRRPLADVALCIIREHILSRRGEKMRDEYAMHLHCTALQPSLLALHLSRCPVVHLLPPSACCHSPARAIGVWPRVCARC
jgi:hypothetical protein